MSTPAELTAELTMDEVARHDGRDGSYWIEVQGAVYDVTDFVPRHPGGGLATLGAGRHATTLFESYHPGPSLDRARRALGKQVAVTRGLDRGDRVVTQGATLINQMR